MRDVKVRVNRRALGLHGQSSTTINYGHFYHLFRGPGAYPFRWCALSSVCACTLLPWTLFSDGLTRSTTSMVTNSNVMTKVYFPRLIMPLASIISPLVDFSVSFIILLAMIVYSGVAPTLNIVFLPLFILLALASSLGVGLGFRRSMSNIVISGPQFPSSSRFGYSDHPVVYSSSLVPVSLRVWLGLNPMAGVIEGFQVAPARYQNPQRDGCYCLGRNGYPASGLGYVLLPEDGAVLCGYCVNGSVICPSTEFSADHLVLFIGGTTHFIVYFSSVMVLYADWDRYQFSGW